MLTRAIIILLCMLAGPLAPVSEARELTATAFEKAALAKQVAAQRAINARYNAKLRKQRQALLAKQRALARAQKARAAALLRAQIAALKKQIAATKRAQQKGRKPGKKGGRRGRTRAQEAAARAAAAGSNQGGSGGGGAGNYRGNTGPIWGMEVGRGSSGGNGFAYATYHYYAPQYYTSSLYCADAFAPYLPAKPDTFLLQYPWTAYCNDKGLGPMTPDKCGRCLKATNPRTGQWVKMRVVDMCGQGGVDMDPLAFNAIDGDGAGVRDGHMNLKLEWC